LIDAVRAKNLTKLFIFLLEYDPESSYSHGNYGAFLLRRDRYEEAERAIEKAIELGSYGLAVRDFDRGFGTCTARNRIWSQ